MASDHADQYVLICTELRVIIHGRVRLIIDSSDVSFYMICCRKMNQDPSMSASLLAIGLAKPGG